MVKDSTAARSVIQAGIALLLSALPAIASEVTMPGCAPGSGEKIAEYTARVYLNRKFSPQWPPTREQVREAILQQSRYLVNPTSMPSLVPSSVAPEIEILSEKDGTYPLELAVDRIQHPHVQLTHPYLKKALERGFAFKDDPARVIEYRARIKLAHCISASALKQSADLPASLWLPPDPHLAFWLVPSTQRRPLRYGQTFWVTSPCATHEVVEIIDPQQHWYVWNPLAHGKDQEGVPYDCRKILGSERLLSIAVKFQSPASDPNNGAQAGGDADADWISALASRPGPLTISAVFGIWRIQGAPLDTRKIAELFQGKDLQGPTFHAAIARAFHPGSARETLNDPGALHFLWFLRSLSDASTITRLLLESRGGADASPVLLTLEGTLNQSQKPYRLRAYFGVTDFWRKGAHGPTIQKGLLEDDVVFYNGHAGMGGNLDLLKLPEIARKKSRKTFQLIGILSCYSYRYYESPLLALRQQQKGLMTEIFTTGTPYYSTKLLPSVFQSLDARLAGKKVRIEDGWKRDIRDGEFLIVKRVRS